jgi:hypothetical protein
MRLESYPLVFQFSQIYLGGGAIGVLVISGYNSQGADHLPSSSNVWRRQVEII